MTTTIQTTTTRDKIRAKVAFELANEIVEISADDQLFEYDREAYKSLDAEKPWKQLVKTGFR